MEMVASSKMRKTQDRMEMGRPYANRMLSVIGHLANSNPEYKPLDGLMQRYVESLVYQAVIENIACEQAAKMVAMKNATENAGTIIDELQLIYNNARQAAITQELSEIVAGAEAI